MAQDKKKSRQEIVNKIVMEKYGEKFKSFVASTPYDPKNKKALFIDDDYYKSEFQAGIDSNISYQWISLLLNRSGGQPAYCKIYGSYIIPEQWIRNNF